MRPAPLLLFVLALRVLPLALGPEAILRFELPGGLPLGTLLAALAFVDDAADAAVFWRWTAGLAGLVSTTMPWAGASAFLARRSRAHRPRDG